MTKINIDPGTAYFANSLFEALGPVGKKLFGNETGLREFLRRDRKTTKFFNSKELHPESDMVRTVIQGSDVIEGFAKLSKRLGTDMLDVSQYRVYGEVQRINPTTHNLFDDYETIQANPLAGVFVIRAVTDDSYKTTAEMQKLYFFSGRFVRSVGITNKPTLNRGRDAKLLPIQRAILSI